MTPAEQALLDAVIDSMSTKSISALRQAVVLERMPPDIEEKSRTAWRNQKSALRLYRALVQNLDMNTVDEWVNKWQKEIELENSNL
jgi:hypothetical protein